MTLTDRARAFLDDAHRNGHRGPQMLRRWALSRNGDRRTPGRYVTVAVLEEAIRLEEQKAEEVA